MDNDFASLSGLLLMFVLGLRHGLDPDHIAIIDGMVFRSLTQRPRVAPWIGTLFAAGHGLTVTAIAVALSSLARDMSLPKEVTNVLDWLPVALLLLVGTLNLRALLTPGPYQAVGWKKHFIPKRLQNSSHPVAIFLVGVIFALVFDTATQAAAWGYVATAQGGTYMAMAVGLSFTAGMIITDTLDGRLMCRLLQRTSKTTDAQRYRRRVGWIVVALAYGVALYSIGSHWYPAIELSETLLTAFGIGMFATMLCMYFWIMRKPNQPTNEPTS